jgi:hypothetical protein
LLEARRPVEWVVYLDDNGEPIYEPGKTYGPFVVEAPRELTAEEWLARINEPQDPERLKREREQWLQREKRRAQCRAQRRSRVVFESQSPPGETSEEWIERRRLEERKLAELEGRDG